MDESSEIVEIIKNLDEEITVLVVDHDMDMVFEIAEWIIVLHYGEVIADGTPEAIQTDRRVREIYMGIDAEAGAG